MGIKFFFENNGFSYKEVPPDKITYYRKSKDRHINKIDDIDAFMIASWLIDNKVQAYSGTIKNESDLKPLSRELSKLSAFSTRLENSINDILKGIILGLTTIKDNF